MSADFTVTLLGVALFFPFVSAALAFAAWRDREGWRWLLAAAALPLAASAAAWIMLALT